MAKCFLFVVFVTLVAGASADVSVQAPANDSQVSSPVQYIASATTDCPNGVAAMGIYTAPYVLAYKVQGSSLNTELNLSPGNYNTMVQEWDNCGGGSKTPINITVEQGSGVNVSSPSNNTQVSSPVHYVATATTTCDKGVAAMGIYTAPNQLAYLINGASLNTNLNLNDGNYNTVVQEWDNCGGGAKTPINITVTGNGGNTFYNLQEDTPGWTGYGLLPPDYGICTTCKSSGPYVTWSWTPGITNPSKSGDATETTIGGETDYADVLWNNHLIGDFSSQGLPDTNHTLVPTLHNFTYDVWFYASDVELSQALEFDINQFENGKSFIWGHECRVAGGHEWDTWDNAGQYWVASGYSCNPVNGWNHLVIQVERTSDDHLLFQTITLNGQQDTLNRYDSPTATTWYGVTINYQIDGDSHQDPYTIYIDELNFTYQ